MKHILVTTFVDGPSLARLKAIPGVTIQIQEFGEEHHELPGDLLRDQHILFCMLPPDNISDMVSLEWIQLGSAGYSQLFDLGLVEQGVRACNARGVASVPIAEWCIAMLVNLARDIPCLLRNQADAVWDRSPKRFQREIRGSTVGIWGYGAIGRETARLAKALGMRVLILDQCRPEDVKTADIYTIPGTGDPDGTLPDHAFLPGQEEAFLGQLDFLIVSVPLTKRTTGIVDERMLRMLPRSAFVLNPARGPLIEEQALINALQQGWIAGAALDAHYAYPLPTEHPLWKMPNVILTPHISGSVLSTNFVPRTWDLFLRNVERMLAGRPLLNELSSAQINGA